MSKEQVDRQLTKATNRDGIQINYGDIFNRDYIVLNSSVAPNCSTTIIHRDLFVLWEQYNGKNPLPPSDIPSVVRKPLNNVRILKEVDIQLVMKERRVTRSVATNLLKHYHGDVHDAVHNRDMI